MEFDMETLLTTANTLIDEMGDGNEEYARGIREFLVRLIEDDGTLAYELDALVKYAIKGAS